MKKSKVLLVMLLMSLAITATAMTPVELRINGVSLVRGNDGTLVPESMNEQFLKGVYIGTMRELADNQIFITDFEHADNYTIAVLKTGGDYYLGTYKLKGGIIDGAFLLHDGDIVMGCDYSNTGDNKMYSNSSTVMLEDGKVSVTRNFTTGVNVHQPGGPVLTEDGSWTKVYVVDESGKISVETNQFYSKWTEADNMSVPGNRGEKTITESDKCRSLGLGMNFLSLYTEPVSQENEDSPEIIDKTLGQFEAMLHNPRLRNAASDISNCFSFFASRQAGLVLRNPNVWLSWLEKKPESKSMEIVNNSLRTNQSFRTELLKELKSLKDKKLRKAWERRLK
ncbi:MAG: hypothetical protein IK100_04030 [Muribaculaceae bacterium]|nr:hypothetical protein [Muribaculaceae bacterium]